MVDGSLVVRPALEADGPTLEAIAAEAGLTFTAERELARVSAAVLVAERAGVPVGFGTVQLAGDEAEILDLAVALAERRTGIGQRLVEELVATARLRAAARLLLEVRRSNALAIRLYERAGFVQVGERVRYYRDGEDALLLARALEEPA